MKKAFELNKALFEAVAACNYEEAERLLNMGADPLGSTDETDPNEHLLGELFMRTEWILPPATSLRMTETTSTRFGC